MSDDRTEAQRVIDTANDIRGTLSAFSTNHPKFPWPKKHDLVDQTPEFQAAFNEVTEYVNDKLRDEIIEHKRIESERYRDEISDLKIALSNARFWNTLTIVTIGICIGAFIIGFMLGKF